MSHDVFINYRRSLNLKDAQLLYSMLQRTFGRSGIFLDVSGLDGGDHWLHTIEKQVDRSAVMVVLIGKGWSAATNEKGKRRLDDPDDFVRFEIARAFSRAIPVLPVLVDGARMPDISELPTNLAALSFPQAMLFRQESAADDASRIAHRLKSLIASARPRGGSRSLAAAGAAIGLLSGIAVGLFVLPNFGLPLSSAVRSKEIELRHKLSDSERKLADAER